MVYITQVHLEGGAQHEHIASVRWRNPDNGATGQDTRSAMVDWIRGGGNARVTDGQNTVQVDVVYATPPYLRTKADGTWTDNLLALPRY